MLVLTKNKITCPIFLSKEGIIGVLHRYIFETKSFQDKVMRTYELLNEVEGLLDCPYFEKDEEQCTMCQRICKFREKVANQNLNL